MSKVALVRCEDYIYENVDKAVESGIKLIGGIKQFVKEGDNVILKPNLLTGKAEEMAVTTHPSVFRAVAKVFLAQKARVSYGDSPGFGSAESIAKKCGLDTVAKELGLSLIDFDNFVSVMFSKGVQNKSFVIAKEVMNADCLVSIPKMKTHGFMHFTGAVKNQFGCVPGIRKMEFHAKIPDKLDFARMLVDLNRCINPKLYIMDGIVAMEGNGPLNGNPKAMKLILFSTDPIALDATACRIIGLKPENIPTIIFGYEAGAGTYKEEDIELVGDDINIFIDKTFVIANKPSSLLSVTKNKYIRKLSELFVPKPFITRSLCVQCGICTEVCPVKPQALNFDKNGKNKPPSYNYNKCIKCYCCQELCPYGAIKLKSSFMRRILGI